MARTTHAGTDGIVDITSLAITSLAVAERISGEMSLSNGLTTPPRNAVPLTFRAELFE